MEEREKTSKLPFVIIAVVIAAVFLTVGLISYFGKKKDEPPAPPTPTSEPDPEVPVGPSVKPVDYL